MIDVIHIVLFTFLAVIAITHAIIILRRSAPISDQPPFMAEVAARGAGKIKQEPILFKNGNDIFVKGKIAAPIRNESQPLPAHGLG